MKMKEWVDLNAFREARAQTNKHLFFLTLQVYCIMVLS